MLIRESTQKKKKKKKPEIQGRTDQTAPAAIKARE